MLKGNELNKLIMEAIKSHDSIGVSVLRAIKTAILNWTTAKENIGKTYSEVDEVALLKKIKSQYLETAEACNDGKHDNMVQEARLQAEYVDKFLPAPVTEEDIFKCLSTCDIPAEQKNMGQLIKHVKSVLPMADGKEVAECVKKHINK